MNSDISESTSGEESDCYEWDSAEENDDDLLYSSNSGEENETEDIEEDTLVRDIPEDYAPSGVESDDDSGKCCHWSKQRGSVPGAIKTVSGTPEQRKHSQTFPDNYKPHDLVETVLDDAYLDMCIAATNEHSTEDSVFQKRIGRIETNEKGRAFLKGYFAIDMLLSLLGHHQRE